MSRLLTELPGDTSLEADLDILLLSHAGGLITTYTRWLEPLRREFSRLGAISVRVMTAVLPGQLGSLEIFQCPTFGASRLTSYGRRVARELGETHERARHLVIFGHSMGALLAVEVCRALEWGSRGADLTVFSGCAAPVSQPQSDQYVGLSRMDDALLTRTLLEMGGLPQIMAEYPERLSPFLPGLRRDLELVDEYQFRDTALPATRALLTLSGTKDPRALSVDVALWGDLLGRDNVHQEFEGDHFFPHHYVDDVSKLMAVEAVASTSCRLPF